jgi:hypothetical protein
VAEQRDIGDSPVQSDFGRVPSIIEIALFMGYSAVVVRELKRRGKRCG